MTYFSTCLRRSFAVALTAGLGAGVAFGNTAEIVIENPEFEARSGEVLPAGFDARAMALKGQIAERFAPDGPVDAFYAGRGYRPMWLGVDGTPDPATTWLVAALKDAARHALPVELYDGAALETALGLMAAPAERTPERIAKLEAALTAAFLSYSEDVSSGLLEPRAVSRQIMVDPPRPDPIAILTEVALARDPEGFFAGLGPQSAEYALLQERYRVFIGIAATGDWAEPVPSGRSLRVGDRADRVVALRNRLIALGDFQASEAAAVPAATELANASDATLPLQTTDPRLYDPELVAAVERFQARHGLNVDGIVGPATLGALNTSAVFRAQQIAVNLERMRWMNRPLGDRHIWVNIPDFHVYLIDEGAVTFTSRVVVGKKGEQETPEFSDQMEHMVVNPTWYIPRSIATKQILPQLRANPGYLAARNMRLSGGTDPYSVDWSQVTARNFRWSIRQGPGANNALGRVKFMFPNDHAIYLHDTPAKGLFSRDIRAYSHGCVRVEKPYDFAHALLAPQEADPEAAFSRWLRRGSERYVNLEVHVPVHLAYRTAWVDAAGVDQFRQDVYGRDALVARALRKAGVALPEL